VTLTGKQKRHLRALGHELAPVLQLGKGGSTEAVIAAAEVQLEAHELIKVRLGTNATEERRDAADALASATGSEVAQVLGRTFLLYRARREKPAIKLPASGRE
jgi:RNA-binding protein